MVLVRLGAYTVLTMGVVSVRSSTGFWREGLKPSDGGATLEMLTQLSVILKKGEVGGAEASFQQIGHIHLSFIIYMFSVA